MVDDVRAAERFFEGHPGSFALFRAVWTAVAAIGPVSVRTSRSQVAFGRRRGFAWLWMPGMWLRHPTTGTVLSIAVARHDPSPRFKEVVHPSRRVFMHHLELNRPAAVDAQVVDWLRGAYVEGACGDSDDQDRSKVASLSAGWHWLTAVDTRKLITDPPVWRTQRE